MTPLDNHKMYNWLKKLFSRKAHNIEKIEKLRISFKDRYNHFKQLLKANNKALELMTELEVALTGVQPFGMSFVRDRCTRISTNVYKMVKHLNELNPKRYKVLFDRFNTILKQINSLIQDVSSYPVGPLIVPLTELNNTLSDLTGGKMANLGEIKNRLNLNVPNGFVITATAYQRFIEHNDLQTEINRRIQATKVEQMDERYDLCSCIQGLVRDADIPEDVEQGIIQQYRTLEELEMPGVKVAMRSSALEEDNATRSFAGQYKTLLNVSKDDLLQAYKEVIAGKYSIHAFRYRLNRGIRDEEVAMCVGCISMVDAVAGGVMYTRNPNNANDDTIIINSTWGLPKHVVDGTASVDVFKIKRGVPLKIDSQVISKKKQKYINSEDGINLTDILEEESLASSLSSKKAIKLAEIALQLESYYKTPQDIEWAIDSHGAIVILQCRTLVQTELSEDRDDVTGDEAAADLITVGGVTASPGVAFGEVFVLCWEKDARHIPQGAILVTSQAFPQWAMLLDKTKAIVTEQGTVTGHLANVSREFGVPALFGVKNATELFKSGHMITVDANRKRVYSGRVDALLNKEQTPRNLMEGSTVFELLKSTAGYIIPLNLRNPESVSFKPDRCESLHDITRFCHEKSVVEMFNFGKNHHFPERSSKQLFTDMPMKWWVLNLDDGFKEEVKGKYIKLDTIDSIPMLALWKGITWKPWVGPPPFDGKGFMSVMFEATRNTAISTTSRSPYSDRNYFIISKNFCSLSSRLGFHFSIIETLISDRTTENYITFQFRGGAADSERKQKRLLFIKEILDDYEFVTEIREDNLRAQLDDLDQQVMIQKLIVLGYLTIHTRQLDMIMSNSTSVDFHKTQILDDLREIVSES